MTAATDLPTIPRIGDQAPNFTAVTTQGEITFHEWKGDSWCVFFSHPADFTPVCTTELTALARRQDEFTSRSCKLLGLSIDSIHSHLAWRENIAEKLGVEIPYPMVADIGMKVAQRYGMIHPGESATVTVRALFVVDPRNTIRAMVYYPLNTGRSVDELVRLLDALQTADTKGVACPVNWRPGEKVIVPPPRTEKEVADRKASDYEKVDFYLVMKDL